jgi:hypothetical protein
MLIQAAAGDADALRQVGTFAGTQPGDRTRDCAVQL